MSEEQEPHPINVSIDADATGVVTIHIDPPSGLIAMPAITAMLIARDLMKAATMANNEIKGKIYVPTVH